MPATASCKFPFLDKWKGICEKNKGCEFFDSILSGYAQIAFNDNSFSGVLMIAATCLGSPIQAFSAIWTIVIGTLTAYLTGISRDLIRRGLYGFNAALAGLAIPVLMFPGQGITGGMLIILTLAGIMCTFLTVVLGKFFGKWGVPSLAAPYCICVIILISAGVLLGILEISPAGLITNQPALIGIEFIIAGLNGIAQVLWLDQPICGLIYLIAVLLASRLDVISSIIGAVVGTVFAIALGLPTDTILSGAYGSNAVLLMYVMTRGFAPGFKSYSLAILGAGFTLVVGTAVKFILAPLGVESFLAIPYICSYLHCFVYRS